jgi:nucleotide-binding universal stress UspA family protein
VGATGHRVWRTIVETADERDAAMIALGRRRGSGLRTSLPGSVSRAVVAHCERPVVVVPCEREPRRYRRGSTVKMK